MDELFKCGKVIVTSTTFKYGNQSYQIDSIKNISYSKFVPKIHHYLIGIILVLFSILCFLKNKLHWVLLGCILLAVGLAVLIEISKRNFEMVVVFSDGKKINFDFTKIELAESFKNAIDKAKDDSN